MLFHDRDEAPIAWREAGSGEVVLFLHGMPGSRTSWDRQLAHLAPAYRCVAWDMPGYGATPPWPEPAAYERALEALWTLLGALRADAVHLVGLSLGGMIALRAAIARREAVRSLAVMDCSPAFGLDGSSKPGEFVASWLEKIRDATSEELAREVIPAITAETCSAAAREEAIAAMSRATKPGLEAAIRLIAAHNVRDGLSRIACPALILVGENDAETPPAYARYLAEHIAGARLAVISGAGHLANQEAPDAVNARLAEFLSAL